MENSKKIETGQDRLIELIRRKKKLTVAEAAADLGVTDKIVREWAEMLEDDGLLLFEDNFGTSHDYLSEPLLNKPAEEIKTRLYSPKKEGFIENVELSLESLRKDFSEFDDEKRHFEQLKEAIGSDWGIAKKQLEELDRYNALKKNLEVGIKHQEKSYNNLIEGCKTALTEEKDKAWAAVEMLAWKISQANQTIESLKLLGKELKEMENCLNSISDTLNGEHMNAASKNVHALSAALDEVEKMFVSIESANKKIIQMESERLAKVSGVKASDNKVSANSKSKKESKSVSGKSDSQAVQPALIAELEERRLRLASVLQDSEKQGKKLQEGDYRQIVGAIKEIEHLMSLLYLRQK